MLTAPAPSTKHCFDHERAHVEETFRRRARLVLGAFAARGHQTIVLGAWGCGAFGGDPVLVADIFAELLEGDFKSAFSRVVFGVLVMRSKDEPNFEAFNKRLS